jgi:hypothetical protein
VTASRRRQADSVPRVARRRTRQARSRSERVGWGPAAGKPATIVRPGLRFPRTTEVTRAPRMPPPLRRRTDDALAASTTTSPRVGCRGGRHVPSPRTRSRQGRLASGPPASRRPFHGADGLDEATSKLAVAPRPVCHSALVSKLAGPRGAPGRQPGPARHRGDGEDPTRPTSPRGQGRADPRVVRGRGEATTLQGIEHRGSCGRASATAHLSRS